MFLSGDVDLKKWHPVLEWEESNKEYHIDLSTNCESTIDESIRWYLYGSPCRHSQSDEVVMESNKLLLAQAQLRRQFTSCIVHIDRNNSILTICSHVISYLHAQYTTTDASKLSSSIKSIVVIRTCKNFYFCVSQLFLRKEAIHDIISASLPYFMSSGMFSDNW
jgi:hypothetical protein